jgi:hypothetical protein
MIRLPQKLTGLDFQDRSASPSPANDAACEIDLATLPFGFGTRLPKQPLGFPRFNIHG